MFKIHFQVLITKEAWEPLFSSIEQAHGGAGVGRWECRQGQDWAHPAAFLTSALARLYGFKIHPMAYQLQLQAASNFKSPVKTIR